MASLTRRLHQSFNIFLLDHPLLRSNPTPLPSRFLVGFDTHLPQALLHCAKNSMNMLKNRIQSRTGGTGVFLFVQKPFFEVRNSLAA